MEATSSPKRRPSGNQIFIASPMMRPKAAPILKIGIRLPDGTGSVEAKTVKKNFEKKSELNKVDVRIEFDKQINSTYSGNHINTEIHKYVAIRIGPVFDNGSLFYRQIIAHPSEIGKQTNDLLTGGQCRGEELTKTEREVQGCDEK